MELPASFPILMCELYLPLLKAPQRTMPLLTRLAGTPNMYEA